MNREKIIELAREAELARQFALEVPFVVDRLERFVALIEREVRGDAEPVAFEFQHEDTGLIDFVDPQQVEWGFQKNNPRWQLIGPVFRHPAPAVDAEKDAIRYRWLKENSAKFSWNPSRYNERIVDGLAAFGTGYLGYNFEQAVDLAMEAALAAAKGGEMMCTKNPENLTRPREPVNGVTICPRCGSEDTTTVSQEENGEIVCAADSCMKCGHQWNVG